MNDKVLPICDDAIYEIANHLSLADSVVFKSVCKTLYYDINIKRIIKSKLCNLKCTRCGNLKNNANGYIAILPNEIVFSERNKTKLSRFVYKKLSNKLTRCYVCNDCSCYLNLPGQPNKYKNLAKTTQINANEIYSIKQNVIKLVHINSALYVSLSEKKYIDAGFKEENDDYVYDFGWFALTIQKQQYYKKRLVVDYKLSIEYKCGDIDVYALCQPYISNPSELLNKIEETIRANIDISNVYKLLVENEFKDYDEYYRKVVYPYIIDIDKESFNFGCYEGCITVYPDDDEIQQCWIDSCKNNYITIDAFLKFLNKKAKKSDLKYSCFNCGKPAYDECDNCELRFCGQCEEFIIDEYSCEDENCYYCLRGCCFKNRVDGRYCLNCCPLFILAAYRTRIAEEKERKKQRKQEEEIRLAQEPIRRAELVKALKEAGLTLRSDSGLCQKYIATGEPDLSWVVRRMGEVRYLFEYCNMKREIELAQADNDEELDAGYFPDCSAFDLAEYKILKRIGKYPEIFPWTNK